MALTASWHSVAERVQPRWAPTLSLVQLAEDEALPFAAAHLLQGNSRCSLPAEAAGAALGPAQVFQELEESGRDWSYLGSDMKTTGDSRIGD